MMYRRNIAPVSSRAPRKGLAAWLCGLCAVLLTAAVCLAANRNRAAGDGGDSALSAGEQRQCRRIERSEIPPIDVHTMVYRTLFNDTNATQLASAMHLGIHDPATLGDPARSRELVRVESGDRYWLDTMHYSLPYLVPQASLLLTRIATRFQEVMKENYPNDPHTYRLVVTSCFRSQAHVDRLRQCNRNASENSCHRYGTTMDISYKRFLTEAGDTLNELFLKQMLAKTLYELRYEGLCWVKYEHRQACFHLTLRGTEYTGRQRYVLEPVPASLAAAPAARRAERRDKREEEREEMSAAAVSPAAATTDNPAARHPSSSAAPFQALSQDSPAVQVAGASFVAPAIRAAARRSPAAAPSPFLPPALTSYNHPATRMDSADYLNL